MPVTNDREYRTIPISQIETRTDDDGGLFVEGYATTFNHRYTLYSFDNYVVDEEVAPDAFDNTDMGDVIMQFDHSGRVMARTRNKTLELTVDPHGLHVRARLDGTEIGTQLYEEIKGGYVDRMSMGFVVGKDSRTYEEDHDNGKEYVHRRILAISKLYDVSAVSIPANDATEISARKFGDGAIADLKAERLAAEQRRAQIQKLKILTEV